LFGIDKKIYGAIMSKPPIGGAKGRYMKKSTLFFLILVILLLAPVFAEWLPMQTGQYYIYVQMLENSQPIAPETGRVMLYIHDQDNTWPNYYWMEGVCYAGEQGRLRFLVRKFANVSGAQKRYKFYMKAQFKAHPEEILISPTYYLDSTHDPFGTMAKEYRFHYYAKLKGVEQRKIDSHIQVEESPAKPQVQFNQIKNAEPMR
jgi:hypothetical protein